MGQIDGWDDGLFQGELGGRGEVLADAVHDPGGEGSGDGRDEQHPVYLQLCGGVKNKTLSENIIRGQKNIK